MPFFRKIATIEARQFNPADDFLAAMDALEWCGATNGPDGYGIVIPTLEDGPDQQVPHYVTEGASIARGSAGEFYPIKPDIFAATYVQVHTADVE